jgi:hypothetical protein
MVIEKPAARQTAAPAKPIVQETIYSGGLNSSDDLATGAEAFDDKGLESKNSPCPADFPKG